MSADGEIWSELAAAQSRGDLSAVADAEHALSVNPSQALAARYGLGSCANAGATEQ